MQADVEYGEYPVPPELKGDRDFALFSDGACRGNPGPGSWGVMGQNFYGDVLFEASAFDSETTNNKMELTGAIKALELFREYLEDNEYKTSEVSVHLYTDSKYIVNGMNEWRHNWKKRGWKKADNKTVENVELWKALDEESFKVKRFHIYWVKGHANHPQNERCDQLCNTVLDREML
ncbi:MAG: ribonuclease HI [Halobacteriovoraceae bacterium]|nr:ribonuclease HI [Halobacteriovoraceae bacterium]MCB9095696.1 ribonuclease HI [Halobacteriovoraceae bacterium]